MNTYLAFFKNLTFGKKILLLSSPIITILLSMQAALLGLGILLIIDFLTGVNKSLRQKNIPLNIFKKVFWLAIESSQLRKSWRKSYEYGIGIIVIAVLRSLIIGEETLIPIFSKTFSLIELAVVIPAIIEVWSIFENIEALTGRNQLKKLFTLFPKALKVLLGDKNKEDI